MSKQTETPEPPRTIVEIHTTYCGKAPTAEQTRRYISELQTHLTHLNCQNTGKLNIPPGSVTAMSDWKLQDSCRQTSRGQSSHTHDQV